MFQVGRVFLSINTCVIRSCKLYQLSREYIILCFFFPIHFLCLHRSFMYNFSFSKSNKFFQDLFIQIKSVVPFDTICVQKEKKKKKKKVISFEKRKQISSVSGFPRFFWGLSCDIYFYYVLWRYWCVCMCVGIFSRISGVPAP